MRGRKPKSTAQQMAEGNPRKHGVHKLEAKAKAEPKPARGLPPCPKHLKRKGSIRLALLDRRTRSDAP